VDRSTDTSAYSGLLAAGIVVYVIFILAIVAFSIWIYWRILTKAGFNGALALLILIPGIGSLIVILMLAFGKWPIETELEALRAGAGGRPPLGGPIGGPPMTTTT
jgi:uncharacterized membrane protein YhaH (DUF805 family)